MDVSELRAAPKIHCFMVHHFPCEKAWKRQDGYTSGLKQAGHHYTWLLWLRDLSGPELLMGGMKVVCSNKDGTVVAYSSYMLQYYRRYSHVYNVMCMCIYIYIIIYIVPQ